MFHLRNKSAFILLCAILAASCGFIDLRPIKVSVEPDKTGSILAQRYSPVTVSFDTEMEKNDTEGVLQVISDAGVVRGDRFWDGNNLYFVPTAGWTAGVRYTLSLSGTVRSADGRELRLERFVSFYAINKCEPPLLEWFYPAVGASVGTADFALELRFSLPMDRLSVESALSIDGIPGKIFEWQDEKTLKVIPDKNLSAWTQYRWNLKESAQSSEGAPIAKAYSSHFTTDLDRVLPRVEKVFPVINSANRWYPTGADIETGLQAGQGIAVQFNKIMGESVLRSVRFEPGLAGRAELLSENSIVYIFSKNPAPQTTYTMIVSGDTKDSEGLKLGEEYRISFIPDIPPLNVLYFVCDANPAVIEDFSAAGVLPVTVDPAAGDLYFNVRFSLMLSDEEKQNIVFKITLNPFFPKTLPPTALHYVKWLSDDLLRMGWEGLTASIAGETHYYKLTIPGNQQDISIYLEAVK
jgi:hypothetical protein